MVVSLMLRKALSAKGVIPVMLCLQVIPLLIFPLSSWSLSTQEWWLPVILTLCVVIALVQLLARKTKAMWPWYLATFAQGVNIISRLMMLLPHATRNHEGTQVFNADYFVIAVVAMLLSAFLIWYTELPEVRRKLLAT
jgi:hypothetical protein